MKNILQTHFEKIYCINLDERSDKWQVAQSEFKKYGIENIVERFSGYKIHKKKACLVGCALSHLNILKKCKQDKVKNVLVLEDDIEFLTYSLDYVNKKKNIIESDPADILERGLTQLQSVNWDVFYLGYNIKVKEFCYKKILSDNLFKSTVQLTTHSIAYNDSVYDIIINDLQNVVCAIDVYLGFYLSHKINSINLYPMIGGQREEIASDIGAGKIRTNRWVKRNALYNFMNYK